MKLDELVSAVAEETGVSKAKAKEVIYSAVGKIKKCVNDNDKIIIPEFGTFSRAERAARNGVNPASGAKIKIEAKSVAKFKGSSNFFG